MRDPVGYVSFEGDKVIRHVYQEYLGEIEFLNSNLAKELVNTGKLIPYEFHETKPHEIHAKRISFQSLPIDWCASQLRAAAELTLEISKFINKNNYELKDASAWNIIFIGCEPIFCDHLSFRKIKENKWWAFGQFIRNFVFPLIIKKYKRIDVGGLFRIFKDGPSVNFTKEILGLRIYTTRYWLLIIQTNANKPKKNNINNIKFSIHHNLYEYLKFLLTGLEDQKQLQTWTNYTKERCHYPEEAINQKKKIVSEWLSEINPERVIDLGCNTGEFSNMALSINAEVVAVDGSEACIEKLFTQNRGNKKLYPVHTNLGDVCGGGGWSGEEYKSLIHRLDNWGDVVLMLALIHHLAITESISYKAIADMATKICKKYLIIEYISESDEMFKSLCLARNRPLEDFCLQKQIDAFSDVFELIREFELSGGMRKIVLLKKK